jgi:hypothetical protein
MADLKQFPGGNEPNATKEAIRNMKEQLPAMSEYYKIVAKMTRLKFDALLVEGFSPEEALKLCKRLY